MIAERVQLKRASELLVRSVGGIEAAAGVVGKGHSTVGRWTNRNDADTSISLFDLRELEANAPAPLITMALARLAGGVFIALPQAPGGDEALPLRVMALAKELGELSAQISSGMADGDFSAGDAPRALDELHDLLREGAALGAALELISSGGKG